MSLALEQPASDGESARRRWLLVVVAALAMVATLPGRTHGLGLITEPLLGDLGVDRVAFAALNLWATLLGAALCLPCGWLIDRLGGRIVLLAVTLGLGGAVLGMCRVQAAWGALLLPSLFALLCATRAFGQSALSVVSLALMGRSAGEEKPGLAVGVYSAVVAVGFMIAFVVVKRLLEGSHLGWRALWMAIGLSVIAFGALAFAVIGRRRRSDEARAKKSGDGSGLTLAQSLATPAFWVFGGGTSLYGMIAAGLSLFNQSILAERHFDRSVFLTITALAPLVGLAANLATGWLANRVPQGRLLAAAMVLLAAAMVAFPYVHTLAEVYLYAVALGVAGGMVTVIFFGVWGQQFGTAHIGKIQGAAQMLTVLASASGPLVLAAGQRHFGSYVPVFRYAALASALLALAAWFVREPRAAIVGALAVEG
jgi:MFS family permease